jgi:hypothetical protein
VFYLAASSDVSFLLKVSFVRYLSAIVPTEDRKWWFLCAWETAKFRNGHVHGIVILKRRKEDENTTRVLSMHQVGRDNWEINGVIIESKGDWNLDRFQVRNVNKLVTSVPGPFSLAIFKVSWSANLRVHIPLLTTYHDHVLVHQPSRRPPRRGAQTTT